MNPPTVVSFESHDAAALGDVLSAKTPGRPVKVGLLGCGYFEYWRMYPELKAIVERDLEGVRARLARDMEIVYPGMVDTLDAAEEAGRAFAEARVEAIIVVEGTYLPDFITLRALDHAPNAQVILFNTQTGSNVSPTDDYQATMRNSALIGIAQITGSFRKMRRKYEVVVGETGRDEAYQRVHALVSARQIASRLRGQTLGIVGQVFRGMFDLECDRARVKGGLGPEVMTIQPEHLLRLWNEVNETDADAAAQEIMRRYAVRGVGIDDARKSCRLGLAMRALVQRFRLDGLCFLGQHYIEKMTGAPARFGASMLMEQDGVMAACEGDVGGLVMMQVMHELTGRAPVQLEWGQFDVERNAVFLLGHGIGTPDLAAGPEAVTLTRSPEEWGFDGSGMNYQFIVKPGPVTLGHFLDTPEGWRMFISEGESIPFPCLPCDEIHAMIRVKTPVREYVESVLRAGVAHHVILAHGSVADGLEAVADALGALKVAVR